MLTIASIATSVFPVLTPTSSFPVGSFTIPFLIGPNAPQMLGVAIQAYYYAEAQVHHNTVAASPGGVRAFDNSTINAREFNH